MLSGTSIGLRPVRESDLYQLYSFHIDLANRGEYFPVGVASESRFKKKFRETGFWAPDEGMLLIVDAEDSIVGHIEFFETVGYLDELELSYQIYEEEQRGKGHVTEAVGLMARYLFGRLKANRIRLVIHPDNQASRRVAEKCGFVHEGTSRGAWYHQGRNHDVEIYAILRRDFEPALLESAA